MAKDPSFSGVITGLAAGDKAAAEVVFRRFVHRLIALASRQFDPRFRSKAEPEDVVQSVYLSFLRRNSSTQYDFSDWEGLWAILATITVRKCYDRRKYWFASKRSLNREVGPGMDQEALAELMVLQGDPTPLQQMVMAETMEELIRKQPSHQVRIAELALQGYTGVEIAERCGCSERTVSRVVHRLRTQLTEMEIADNRP